MRLGRKSFSLVGSAVILCSTVVSPLQAAEETTPEEATVATVSSPTVVPKHNLSLPADQTADDDAPANEPQVLQETDEGNLEQEGESATKVREKRRISISQLKKLVGKNKQSVEKNKRSKEERLEQGRKGVELGLKYPHSPFRLQMLQKM